MNWPLLIAALIVLLLLAAAALLALRPFGLGQIASRPRPSSSYDESVERVAALQAEEREGYYPSCVTQLLTHGAKAQRAVVLVHGYTNCPQQFIPLGRQFFERGDNVLVARMPHAGRADRMSAEHGGLTAAEMAAYADEVVDIAVGLGEHVIMAGLSGGGTITAWAAQRRPAARSIVVVTNANDDKVDNAAALRMAQVWRASGATDVTVYEFPADLNLHHDLIDPSEPDARPELVYPKLVELLDGA